MGRAVAFVARGGKGGPGAAEPSGAEGVVGAPLDLGHVVAEGGEGVLGRLAAGRRQAVPGRRPLGRPARLRRLHALVT
ncbi:hypothetical protein [Streptomyces sp. NPDC054783]